MTSFLGKYKAEVYYSMYHGTRSGQTSKCRHGRVPGPSTLPSLLLTCANIGSSASTAHLCFSYKNNKSMLVLSKHSCVDHEIPWHLKSNSQLIILYIKCYRMPKPYAMLNYMYHAHNSIYSFIESLASLLWSGPEGLVLLNASIPAPPTGLNGLVPVGVPALFGG